MNRLLVPSLAVVATLLTLSAAEAQAPTIKRTLLQRSDLGDGREAIVGLAEIAPGGATGRHTHFGIEIGYVIEGTTTLEVEGEGARTLNAGDSYTIPAGRVHNAAASTGTAKVVATYIIDKGKPLATPAP
jgi:quercetin dioxygenase-like cupin family protein